MKTTYVALFKRAVFMDCFCSHTFSYASFTLHNTVSHNVLYSVFHKPVFHMPISHICLSDSHSICWDFSFHVGFHISGIFVFRSFVHVQYIENTDLQLFSSKVTGHCSQDCRRRLLVEYPIVPHHWGIGSTSLRTWSVGPRPTTLNWTKTDSSASVQSNKQWRS